MGTCLNFRTRRIRPQEQAFNPAAQGFSGPVTVDLSQHAEITVQALGYFLQRFRINRRPLAFPRPDFPLAAGQARLPQIGPARFDDEACEVDPCVCAVQVLLAGMQM